MIPVNKIGIVGKGHQFTSSAGFQEKGTDKQKKEVTCISRKFYSDFFVVSFVL